MKKFKWRNDFYGFIAFAFGIVFLCLNKISLVFVFFAFLFYLGGAINNFIFSLKKYKTEKKDINNQLLQMLEDLKQNNEDVQTESQKQNILKSKLVDEKLIKDAKLYKFGLIINIACYVAIAILAISLFVRLIFLL